MKLHWKSPVVFATISFIIVFIALFGIFVLSRPRFLSKVDSKGKKTLEYGKTVIYSILFALIVAVIVLLYRASQEEFPLAAVRAAESKYVNEATYKHSIAY